MKTSGPPTGSAQIPCLGYALMGLLEGKPSSGYELRQIFSSASMRSYSGSPGAIYPALRRLERQSLIRGTIEAGSGLRRRQRFRLTPKGVAALKAWIARPVTRGDLVAGQAEIMLRFAFSEQAAGVAGSLELLRSFEAALKPYLAALHEQFQASQAAMSGSGRMAFECGVRQTECLLEWVHDAITAHAQQREGGGL
jgi:DNA-binding PadR family transcriptional regulator